MRLGYVTPYDSADVTHFSGSATYMANALEAHVDELVRVGPLRTPREIAYRLHRFAVRRVSRQVELIDRVPSVVRAYGRQAGEALSRRPVDAVIGPSSTALTGLTGDWPVVYWTDATFAGLHMFYADFSRLSRRSIARGHAMERAVLDRCALAVFSSQWAADSARDAYGVEESKVRVVPYGANIVAPTVADLDRCAEHRSGPPWRLLTIAVDWNRKGADLAVRTVAALRDGGLDATLSIVGSRPPAGAQLPDFVESVGFLHKRDPADVGRLHELYARSSLILMPSRADCAPVTVAEANAYGLPVVASRVGGIDTLVRAGENGFLVDDPLDVAAYARQAGRLLTDAQVRRRLAAGARRAFEERLSWDRSVQLVLAALGEVTAAPERSPAA